MLLYKKLLLMTFGTTLVDGIVVFAKEIKNCWRNQKQDCEGWYQSVPPTVTQYSRVVWTAWLQSVLVIIRSEYCTTEMQCYTTVSCSRLDAGRQMVQCRRYSHGEQHLMSWVVCDSVARFCHLHYCTGTVSFPLVVWDVTRVVPLRCEGF